MTLWGGRFSGKLNENAWTLNTSLPVDQRMAIQDVDGSLAWAEAILGAGIFSAEEHQQVSQGLTAIRQEFSQGSFAFAPSDEDIHTAVERRLTELIGAAAQKLHTGRSRNDQVATDFRLWLLQTLPMLQSALAAVQTVLIARAEEAGETFMPGYTHLQRAQPVTVGHHLLAWVEMLERDRERFRFAGGQASPSPLGAGALGAAARNL